jgi:uncharacterized membrane protein YdjX (TVP38/TMEM64 family)|tara:strand:+ start:92 stop:802 length:711 start_codon:yes stop_codon:yes gene_type:complete
MQKIKVFIGLFYLIILSSFLFFLFSNFSFQEVTSYNFIKNNRDYFFELKESNLYFLSIVYIIFTILWIFVAGFGSPAALIAGFIFGKWLGLVFLIFSVAIGATGLYVFANYFLKDFIKAKFLNRFEILEKKFKKAELAYLLIFRFVGGIPFPVANVLPCLFNVKISNYFFAILIGTIPQSFLVVSIGSGLEKIIDDNLNAPKAIDLITAPDIYLPIIIFFILFITTILVKKKFYKS